MNDVGLDGHYRLQAELSSVHLVGGIKSVEDDACAASVVVDLGDLHYGCGVCKSLHGDADACVGQRIAESVELLFLTIGVGLVHDVSYGHVAENSHDLGVGKLVDLSDVSDGAIDIGGLVADAAHARVADQKDLGKPSLASCLVIEGLGVLGIATGNGDVVLDDGVSVHGGGQTQHDDVFLETGVS